MPLLVAEVETGALVGDVGGALALTVPATASLSGSCSSWFSSPCLYHWLPFAAFLMQFLVYGRVEVHSFS